MAAAERANLGMLDELQLKILLSLKQLEFDGCEVVGPDWGPTGHTLTFGCGVPELVLRAWVEAEDSEFRRAIALMLRRRFLRRTEPDIWPFPELMRLVRGKGRVMLFRRWVLDSDPADHPFLGTGVLLKAVVGTPQGKLFHDAKADWAWHAKGAGWLFSITDRGLRRLDQRQELSRSHTVHRSTNSIPKAHPQSKSRNMSDAKIAARLKEMILSYGTTANHLVNELNLICGPFIRLSPRSTERREQIYAEIERLQLELIDEAHWMFSHRKHHHQHLEGLVRAMRSRSFVVVIEEIKRIIANLEPRHPVRLPDAAPAKEPLRPELGEILKSGLDSITKAIEHRNDTVPTGGSAVRTRAPQHQPVGDEAQVTASGISRISEEQLKLMIRRQVKAEEKTSLADDIYVAAYRQCGSVRLASAFLSQQVGRVISKDQVHRAVKRSGGVQAVLKAEDSESIQRVVASQRRDKQRKYASPTQPPDID